MDYDILQVWDIQGPQPEVEDEFAELIQLLREG